MKFHLGEASCPTRAAPSRHTQRPQQNSAPAGQWTSSHHDSEPPPTNEPRAERHNLQTTQHGGRTAYPAQPEDKGSSAARRPKHPLPWHPPSTPAVPWEAAAGTSRIAIAVPLCMAPPQLRAGGAAVFGRISLYIGLNWALNGQFFGGPQTRLFFWGAPGRP